MNGPRKALTGPDSAKPPKMLGGDAHRLPCQSTSFSRLRRDQDAAHVCQFPCRGLSLAVRFRHVNVCVSLVLGVFGVDFQMNLTAFLPCCPAQERGYARARPET